MYFWLRREHRRHEGFRGDHGRPGPEVRVTPQICEHGRVHSHPRVAAVISRTAPGQSLCPSAHEDAGGGRHSPPHRQLRSGTSESNAATSTTTLSRAGTWRPRRSPCCERSRRCWADSRAAAACGAPSRGKQETDDLPGNTPRRGGHGGGRRALPPAAAGLCQTPECRDRKAGDLSDTLQLPGLDPGPGGAQRVCPRMRPAPRLQGASSPSAPDRASSPLCRPPRQAQITDVFCLLVINYISRQ